GVAVAGHLGPPAATHANVGPAGGAGAEAAPVRYPGRRRLSPGLIFHQAGERCAGRYADSKCLATTPSWPAALPGSSDDWPPRPPPTWVPGYRTVCPLRPRPHSRPLLARQELGKRLTRSPVAGPTRRGDGILRKRAVVYNRPCLLESTFGGPSALPDEFLGPS